MDCKSHETDCWNDKCTLHTTTVLLLDNNLRLLLHVYLRCWLNNNLSDLSYRIKTSNKFRSKTNPTSSVKGDCFFSCAVLGKDVDWNVSLANNLEWVGLVLDNDMNIMLEHICGDFHKLATPTRFFASMMAST